MQLSKATKMLCNVQPLKVHVFGPEPMPAGVNLYYFYDKAQKTKTKGDANVYVLYRQMYLNKFGTKKEQLNDQ